MLIVDFVHALSDDVNGNMILISVYLPGLDYIVVSQILYFHKSNSITRITNVRFFTTCLWAIIGCS